MADILSQEEIDALLDVVDDEGDDALEFEEEEVFHQKQITLYDFKRPNRVSKEQLRAFRGIHDKMARSLSSQISAIMRSIVEIQIADDFAQHACIDAFQVIIRELSQRLLGRHRCAPSST